MVGDDCLRELEESEDPFAEFLGHGFRKWLDDSAPAFPDESERRCPATDGWLGVPALVSLALSGTVLGRWNISNSESRRPGPRRQRKV